MLDLAKARLRVKEFKVKAATDFYGYWITEDGKLLDVPTGKYGHRNALKEYNEKHHILDNLPIRIQEQLLIHDNYWYLLLVKGWVRLVQGDGFDQYNINIGKHRISAKALSKLISFTKRIENQIIVDVTVNSNYQNDENRTFKRKADVVAFLKENQRSSTMKNVTASEITAKETKERYFIRFGDLPKNGRSKLWTAPNLYYTSQVGREYPGISVYEVVKKRNKWYIITDGINLHGMSGLEQLLQGAKANTETIYLLEGKPVTWNNLTKKEQKEFEEFWPGKGYEDYDLQGTDGEPLLRDIKTVKTLKFNDLKFTSFLEASEITAKETKERITNQTVLYHGTAREFKKFSLSGKRNPSTPEDEVNAIFFCDDPVIAYSHARRMSKLYGGKAHIIKATIDFKNLFDATNAVKREKKNFKTYGEAKRHVYSKVDRTKYDGIAFRGDPVNNPEYVVFDPKIIKIIKEDVNKLLTASETKAFWINAEGKLIPLPAHMKEHYDYAEEHFGGFGYAALYKAIESGWVRIRTFGETLIVTIGENSLKDSAIRAFMKYLKENLFDKVELAVINGPRHVKYIEVNSDKTGINKIYALLKENRYKSKPIDYDNIDNLLKDLEASEFENQQYGYWFTDNGEQLDVPEMEHDRTAKQYIKHNKPKAKIDFNSNWSDSKYYVLNQLGWIRVVVTDDSISVEFRERTVSTKAIQAFVKFISNNGFDEYAIDMPGTAYKVFDSKKKQAYIKEIKKYIRNNIEASEGYGAWITDKGEVINVKFEDHSNEADKYISKHLYQEYSDFIKQSGIMSPVLFCLNRGWIRIVNEGIILSIEIDKNNVAKKAYIALIKYVNDNYFDKFSVDLNARAEDYSHKNFELQNADKKFLSFVRSNINKAVTASNTPYGYWITPKGELLEVDNSSLGHGAVFKDYDSKTPTGYSNEEKLEIIAYNNNWFALKHGWIRLVESYTEGQYHINIGKNSVSSKALSKLTTFIPRIDDRIIIEVTEDENQNGKSYSIKQKAEAIKLIKQNVNKAITASLPLPKSELLIDEANNVLPDNSKIVETWSNPEGYKIHLVQIVIPDETSNYRIVVYDPSGQADTSVPEYAFIETAREGLLDMVDQVRDKTVYSKIVAADFVFTPLSRYESADGFSAIEYGRTDTGFAVVDYLRNRINRVWQRSSVSYKSTEEAAKAELSRLLNVMKDSDFKKVELGIRVAKTPDKGFKAFEPQPNVKGLELQYRESGSKVYARIVHTDSGRTLIDMTREPIKLPLKELARRMELSKDLAAVDWTRSTVQLNQTYGQTQVLNYAQRFLESLDIALPSSIQTRSGRTELILDESLARLVKDWLIAKYLARPESVKNIERVINSRIKKEGLNSEEIYSYYGNPSKSSERVWEKIGLIRVGNSAPYKYEFANRVQKWSYAKSKNPKSFFTVSVNGARVADIAVKDENLPKAIVDLGNGLETNYKSEYFKDLKLEKDKKSMHSLGYNIIGNGKIIGFTDNPIMDLRNILLKLRGGEVKVNKVSVKTESKASKITEKEVIDRAKRAVESRMIGDYVEGTNSIGDRVKGILINQVFDKNTYKTSGRVLVYVGGKPTARKLTNIKRTLKTAPTKLQKAYDNMET